MFFFSFFLFFFAWSWLQFFFKEILLVVKIFCIRLSEIELAFRRAGRRCSESLFSMLRFKKLYWMQIFNQYLSNKNDDTCPLLNTNISAWIELSLWRCKRCYEHSTVKFVSTRDYLIPPIYVCIPERVRALEGWTSANFSHYILRTETKTSSAKDQKIYYMITKYFHAPWNYQMNLVVSL